MSARPRWRWITLAEFVAIAGLVIAVTTLWLSWSDRRADDAEKRSAVSADHADRARVTLSGTVADGGDALTLADPNHDLVDTVVAFPAPLGVTPQRPVTPRIEADWIAKPLLAAADAAKADEGRLPVLVTVNYVDGDARRTASGIYDAVWRRESRFLRGHALRLEGLRLRQRGGDQAALDRAWAAEKPR